MKCNPDEKFIAEIPFFSSLSAEEISRFCQVTHLISYSPGEILFKQNTPVTAVMYVCTGLVKLVRDADHRKRCILHLAGAGDFTALQAVFSDELHQYSAAAVDDTSVLMIEISEFHHTISQNAPFAAAFLKQTSLEGARIMTKLLNQYYKQLPGRVAEMLLFFSQKVYKSPVFSLPLTRQELAEFTGTTKESMIRTLAEFRHDKIIRIEGKNVEIISPDIINTLSRLG